MTRALLALFSLSLSAVACGDDKAAASPGNVGAPASMGGQAAGTPATPAAGRPATSAAAATDAAPTAPKVGDRVEAKFSNGYWYPGKITQINPDGTYRVVYDDGDVSRSLPAGKVRQRRHGKNHGATGTTAGGDGCPAGRTRCGDECVNLQSDEGNCGSCGFTCGGSAAACNQGICGCTSEAREANGGACPD